MLDFVEVKSQATKNGVIIYPEFKVGSSKDLMIQGKSFYAIWDEEIGLWSKDETAAVKLIDRMVYEKAEELQDKEGKKLKLLRDFSSNCWTDFQKYCRSLSDNYKELDGVIHFSNQILSKKDYATKTVPYPLQEGPTDAYEELISVLYHPAERKKIEWAIGSIIAGDSKKIQKFLVFYGGPGTGKSTMLNIIQMLFPGYYASFDSKALGSVNDAFSLEAFRENPLLAIQHDGDLSRIEDNTKLNSIVSHEELRINEKFKATYSKRINSFLLMGTNKPVRITDAKSGIIRRLIDVQPTGNTVSKSTYNRLFGEIPFELPGIAYHCLQVYEELGPSYYDSYIPSLMMSATNDFYNFIEDNLDFFYSLTEEEGITLRSAWNRYKEYCDDARVLYALPMRQFRVELRNYFRDYYDRYHGNRSVYVGFLKEKFEEPEETEEEPEELWLSFSEQKSVLDVILRDYPAQYAKEDGTPSKSWDSVKTILGELDTKKLHYVRGPENLIVIDFDLKDETGKKSFEKNLAEASKWPKTYAELSRSGGGIHLHYFYDGDVDDLSRVYDDNIEIKVYKGKSALRRMLTLCNNYSITHISSGLPLKERSTAMLNPRSFQSEKTLREFIKRNLRKEIHDATKPSIDMIKKALDDAHDQGLHYDVRDLRPAIQQFAMGSSNQADYCLRMLSRMQFQSDDVLEEENAPYADDAPIVFFDVEVFSNLFVICWKKQGEGANIVRMIQPTPAMIEPLLEYKLVGFNNRKYDNHIIYAALMGYNNQQLYELSQRIIAGEKDAFFGEAYSLSFTDIYDYSSDKKSLKKWEIELDIHHQELPFRWDEPIPKSKWDLVAEYCSNDVFATEAVWDATTDDFVAREILAEWAEMTPNDTTNSLTTKLIVGNDRHPQSQFIYTDLSTIFPGYEYDPFGIDPSRYEEGAKIVQGKSIYLGKDPSEGGYALGRPGIYFDVAVLDVASMHPSSIIRLKVFGETYTMNFSNIVYARLCIKHKDFDAARKLLPGKLHRYLESAKEAKKLSKALKIPINSVYGLTSASFENKLRDPRNKDNIVAKYGALFMMTLDEEVRKRGYSVVHIKTDSIKIANADPEIIQFVMDFGKEYGFTFEHESTYSKIALMNDAVYVARYASPEFCMDRYGYVPENNAEELNAWTATGTQFQVPYVFKTLFSHEEITFSDLCETKSVTTAMYLDFNEDLSEEEHQYQFVGKVGSFCPMKDGIGGGILLREGKDGKFGAVVGTKKPGGKEAWRWMEAETVKMLHLEDSIDRDYYRKMVDDAVRDISKYGDFEQFVSDEPLVGFVEEVADNFMNLPMAA